MGRDAQVWRVPFNSIPEDADLDDYEIAHVRIGNLSLVIHLRELISALPDGEHRFPILLHQVLHHGTLSGDSIPFQQVGALAGEVNSLTDNHDEYLTHFKTTFGELCRTALENEKDINF